MFRTKYFSSVILQSAILLIVYICSNAYQNLAAQDIIYLDFRDSIMAEVKNVSDKYVSYALNPYFKQAIDSIKLKKVTGIRYSNGQIEHFRKDFWEKTYFPGVYPTIGGFTGFFDSDVPVHGLGHSGIVRFSETGLAAVYSLEARFGFIHHDYTIDSLGVNYYQGSTLIKFMMINLNSGIEYRYSFNELSGLFINGSVGFSYLILSQPGNYYTTPKLMYNLSSGVYVKQLKYALNYSWGRFVRESSSGADDAFVPEEDKINFEMPSFSITYYF